MNTNDFYTFTLHREDWDRIVVALKVVAAERLVTANRIGIESIYGDSLANDGRAYQAVADHLDFLLPE